MVTAVTLAIGENRPHIAYFLHSAWRTGLFLFRCSVSPPAPPPPPVFEGSIDTPLQAKTQLPLPEWSGAPNAETLYALRCPAPQPGNPEICLCVANDREGRISVGLSSESLRPI